MPRTRETEINEDGAKTCAVAACHRPGNPAPLVIGTDPHREAIVCAEHRALASAGAPWFARELLGGEFVVFMDQALPGRLVNFRTEDALSSEGPSTRVLIQVLDSGAKLSEVEFWAPPGWLHGQS